MGARNKSKGGDTAKILPTDVSLNRIAKILGLLAVKDIKNQGEQISLLAACGFSVGELAEMLGTSTNTVSVSLSQQRTKQKRGRRRENSRAKY